MKAGLFPGQGAQRRGMGDAVFDRFPALVDQAEQILGYSLRELCLEDTGNRLRDTRYAQPALFVVSALSYLVRRENGLKLAFLAGHSLGEYVALFAAGCFDFETGVQLVKERGKLMTSVSGGGMLAVLGLEAEEVRDLLERYGESEVEIANHNAPKQLVLSGPQRAVNSAANAFRRRDVQCIPLNVSAPFHSRYMEAAATAFREFLQAVPFSDPQLPVIANVTGRPYQPGAVRTLLGQQIRSSVRWWKSMRYLIEQGVSEVEEFGPGHVLKGLWKASQAVAKSPPPRNGATPASRSARGSAATLPRLMPIRPETLGSDAFRRDYGIRYPYLAGAMYGGIASAELVIRMGQAGMMGFLGAGGLSLDQVEVAIHRIQRELGPGPTYGMNLLYPLDDDELEEATVALYLRNNVRFAEAAGYLQMTPPLVHFRFKGARRDASGRPMAQRHVLAKVSRPEVAKAFMRPPAEMILRRLVQEGRLTDLEAQIAGELPISEDICVEADSGGHTDGGVALTLVPAMLTLRDHSMQRYGYTKRIRIGAAGGIGTPQAAAAAFVLGAEFILTGSVNQCSPEAGTSSLVKEMLSGLDVQDTAYAPAGDMFELGARVQVVRKGTLFAARANNLYRIYRQYGSLEAIDGKTRRTIEKSYFRRSFEEVWRETEQYLARTKPHEIEKARREPKHKMALLFKWYFAFSNHMALLGVAEEKANYQIQCGPAMGAFNRFVQGTDLEDWQSRHVDLIAERLMNGAAKILSGWR